MAIAELGIPGERDGHGPGPLRQRVPRATWSPWTAKPVPVRVTGSTADAVARKELTVSACGPAPVALSRGEHILRTATGRQLGIDIDQLALASAAGGAAEPLAAAGGRQGRRPHRARRW